MSRSRRAPAHGAPWRRALDIVRRHRLAYWAVAATLVVATSWTIAAATARTERARARLGPLVEVPVVRTDVTAGTLLTADLVRTAELPAAAVPAAVAHDPVGRRTQVDLVAGEVVVATRLTTASSAVAARLAPGTRGVTIPTGVVTPPATVGDAVDVIVGHDPLAFPGRPTSEVVAAGVVVVDITDHAVTVAVPAERLNAVAEALVTGWVTLALSGP